MATSSTVEVKPGDASNMIVSSVPITSIDDLNTASRNKITEVKMYRKWASTSVLDPTLIGVLIPETTFVGVESRVLIPETTFVGVESRVLIPETTVWDTLVYPSDTLVILRAFAISLLGLRGSIRGYIDNRIEFTIWSEMATRFDVKHFEGMEKLVIIAVSSCQCPITEVELTSTPATHYYLDLDISGLQQITAKDQHHGIIGVIDVTKVMDDGGDAGVRTNKQQIKRRKAYDQLEDWLGEMADEYVF
ncbi:hypothetical protein Tco_0156469 [Tanacetum coccineum]